MQIYLRMQGQRLVRQHPRSRRRSAVIVGSFASIALLVRFQLAHLQGQVVTSYSCSTLGSACFTLLQDQDAGAHGGGSGLIASSRHLLPEWAAPIRYNITLDLDPVKTSFFLGRLAVDLALTAPSQDDTAIGPTALTLNSRNLSIALSSVYFQGSVETFGAINITYDLAEETVTLQFGSPLPLGEGVLVLEYSGYLSEDMSGLYRSWYTGEGNAKRVMAITQFEAIDARRAFPCWDEPNKKASFQLSLTVPRELTAISNMPPASERSVGTDKRRVEFLETPRMSTYLLAIAVGEFDSIQQVSSGGVLVRVLSVPGRAEEGRFALDVAVRVLDFYQQYFEVPYPLPKMDMLAAPDFAAGAMENWGLVIYRDVDLLCNASTVSVARRMRIATVVAHELAHQWFGNLVTMDWWDNLWLNEGFANWMQTFAVDELFPEWAIWDQYVVQEQSRALALDALRSSHPIEVPIQRAQEVDEVFDAISYCKGGAVVRMLHALLGKEVFRAGLVIYMKKHSYSNAATADLWACFEEASGVNIASLMNSWTHQKGFPLLNVSDAPGQLRSGALLLTQQWFLADGSEEQGDDEKVWKLPLHPGPLPSSLPRKAAEILTTKEKVWTAPYGQTWLKFNFGQVAPYRVLYSSPAVKVALIDALKHGKVASTDRIGLLFDSLALVRQGHLPVAELLNLLHAISFSGESNAHVWEAIAGVLITLHPVLEMLQDKASNAQRLLAALGDALVRPALAQCGWSGVPGEDDLSRQRRALVVGLASRFLRNDESVLHEALLQFDMWLADPSAGALPDDLKTSVFRIVLANMQDRKTFQKLVSHAANSQTPQNVRLSILSALGSAKDTKLRALVLNMASNGHVAVRLQDIMYPVRSVAAADSAGARQTWEWFMYNHKAIRKRLHGANVRLLGAVIDASASLISETDHADSVETFFQDSPAPGLERSIAQITEAIRAEASFVSRLEIEIENDSTSEAIRSLEAGLVDR